MKKIKIFALVTIFSLLSASMFANPKLRESINKFLIDYETMVIEAESAKGDAKKLDKLANKASRLQLTYAKCVTYTGEWNKEDQDKYTNLSARYNIATGKESEKDNENILVKN